MRMRRIVIYGLYDSTTFFHIFSQIFEKSYWTENVCFDWLYNFAPNIAHS
jgi:hypothetical protein